MMPFFVCSLYYPKKKAIMQGVLSAAYGAGAGLWTIVSAKLNNPTGAASRDVRGEEFGSPFLPEVSKNFPIAMR